MKDFDALVDDVFNIARTSGNVHNVVNNAKTVTIELPEQDAYDLVALLSYVQYIDDGKDAATAYRIRQHLDRALDKTTSESRRW